MDKENLVHKHNGILLSHKNQHIWINSDEVDEPRTYYMEWSGQKEIDKYPSLTHIYTRNLEKQYWRIYLQVNNGETDIENRLVDMGRGEERVKCMERVTWKLILPYVR